jgi:hypothetical protein
LLVFFFDKKAVNKFFNLKYITLSAFFVSIHLISSKLISFGSRYLGAFIKSISGMSMPQFGLHFFLVLGGLICLPLLGIFIAIAEDFIHVFVVSGVSNPVFFFTLEKILIVILPYYFYIFLEKFLNFS